MRAIAVAALAFTVVQAPVSIRGTVVDTLTAQPVRGASVLLVRPDALARSVMATTDIQGHFVFPDVPAGTYRLRAEHDDYVRGDLTPLITVPGEASAKDMTLRVTPTAVISGRVTDQQGEPVVRVFVRAWTTRLVAEARTNDLGEYRLFGLPPGAYLISAERYPGPVIRGTYVETATPPCPDCPGEGIGRSSLAAVLQTGGAIDPRALTGETYPALFYPGTTDRATATPLKAGPGARIEAIDLRLSAR